MHVWRREHGILDKTAIVVLAEAGSDIPSLNRYYSTVGGLQQTSL